LILMNDFKAEPAELRAAMLAAVERVMASGWYVLGKEVEAFEHAWAAACGLNHGVGVGNGLDAIEIALRALGIGPGDEVVTTPMTAFATVLAVLRCGATPVLADIDPDSGLLALESVERCLSPKTRAVLLVHLYGQMRDMVAWRQFCEERHLALVEDCAQAHLARWNGVAAGAYGAAGAYSFYPTKNLGALGDAGMLVTADPTLAERAARLRNYGQSVRYHHPELGMNSRLDEMQAAILGARLNWLAAYTQRRREIAATYRAGLADAPLRLLAAPQEEAAHVHHLFVVMTGERDGLQAHLQARGVQTHIHYPVPVHHQEPCVALRRDPDGLANAERHARECLSLPCHPQMTDEQITHVIEAVRAYV
jgi:dTDP-4-amino-4,6-dideoxygalactose transaminase